MTHVCIKNPHWQSSEIMIFFCKYDVVISDIYDVVILDILVGSFLDVLYCLLAVILSELHEKPRRRNWVTEKVHRWICARHITFLTARPPLFYIIFCCFLLLLPPLPIWCTCWMAPIKMIMPWLVFCVMIPWVNSQK